MRKSLLVLSVFIVSILSSCVKNDGTVTPGDRINDNHAYYDGALVEFAESYCGPLLSVTISSAESQDKIIGFVSPNNDDGLVYHICFSFSTEDIKSEARVPVAKLLFLYIQMGKEVYMNGNPIAGFPLSLASQSDGLWLVEASKEFITDGHVHVVNNNESSYMVNYDLQLSNGKKMFGEGLVDID